MQYTMARDLKALHLALRFVIWWFSTITDLPWDLDICDCIMWMSKSVLCYTSQFV